MATITFLHNTDQYTSKGELFDMIQLAKEELIESGASADAVKSAFGDIDEAVRTTKEVRDIKGKLIRVDKVTEEIELKLDTKDVISSLFDDADEYYNIIEEIFGYIDNEDILEKANQLRPPVKATDMDDYNFKRWLCDVFETGYHVDDFQLIKSVAVRLDKAWEVM